MKQIFPIIMILFLVAGTVGCKSTDDEGKKMKSGTSIYVVVKDNCEYVLFDGYKNGGIVHKQNCKFCEQRKNR